MASMKSSNTSAEPNAQMDEHKMYNERLETLRKREYPMLQGNVLVKHNPVNTLTKLHRHNIP